ncbi:hypothetical protein CPC16_003029 [Podila verticillata]|nr:hypothetical protein CPC16_003029 [Podila verticillata]
MGETEKPKYFTSFNSCLQKGFMTLLEDMEDYMHEERRMEREARKKIQNQAPSQIHDIPKVPPKMEIGHLIFDMSREWEVFQGEYDHNQGRVLGVRYDRPVRREEGTHNKYPLTSTKSEFRIDWGDPYAKRGAKGLHVNFYSGREGKPRYSYAVRESDTETFEKQQIDYNMHLDRLGGLSDAGSIVTYFAEVADIPGWNCHWNI